MRSSLVENRRPQKPSLPCIQLQTYGEEPTFNEGDGVEGGAVVVVVDVTGLGGDGSEEGATEVVVVVGGGAGGKRPGYIM